MQTESVKRETYYQAAPSSINTSNDKVSIQDVIASKKAKLLGNTGDEYETRRRRNQVEEEAEDLEGESPDSESSSPTSKKIYTFKSKQ
jgi:hypothetical protein